jgi:hypothetical protein
MRKKRTYPLPLIGLPWPLLCSRRPHPLPEPWPLSEPRPPAAPHPEASLLAPYQSTAHIVSLRLAALSSLVVRKGRPHLASPGLTWPHLFSPGLTWPLPSLLKVSDRIPLTQAGLFCERSILDLLGGHCPSSLLLLSPLIIDQRPKLNFFYCRS